MQSNHIHFLRDKMREINTWKIYLNVFNFRTHVCIRQLWNIKREENDNYRVKLFKHTRGDKKIRGKVPPLLYPLFKHDKILTYYRAIHMQLINFDNAGVSRPRALQASSWSRHIASPGALCVKFFVCFFCFKVNPNLTSYNKLIFLC